MFNRMRKYIVLCCSVWLVACTKVKVDTNLPVLNTLKSSSSSIRLIALLGPEKVIAVVGGVSYNLTSKTLLGVTVNCQPGLVVQSYGPTPVSLPEKVLDEAGNAHIQVSVVTPQELGGNPVYVTVSNSDTVLPDNPNNPIDYYLTPATRAWEEPNYIVTPIPRSATPPTVPSNIKIRVVNMASPTDTFQRTGPLSLTYADSTPVSGLTSGVPAGVVSDYVEIPYNTYRFRLFNQNGVEVPETIAGGGSSLHQYQPGGVYTVFVNSNNIFTVGDCYTATHVSANSFTVITDVAPPVNTSFGLVQFVNTIPGTTYSLSLDNTTIGNAISFRGVSGYRPMPLGDYSLQLTDGNGQPVVQQKMTIYPNDNWTVWAYKKNGEPALSLTASDLSSPNGLTLRLMNFSVDIPYITFTSNGQVLPVAGSNNTNYYPDINDSTSGADASENLAIGVPATHLPYVTGLNSFSMPLQVNKSDAGPPAFVPGIPLISVRPLQYADLPVQSVYTVALTGLVDTTFGAGSAATDTLLIVKHFK